MSAGTAVSFISAAVWGEAPFGMVARFLLAGVAPTIGACGRVTTRRALSSAAPESSAPPGPLPETAAPASYSSKFLDEVERTVDRVLSGPAGIRSTAGDLSDLDPPDREAVGVSRIVRRRLDAMGRAGDCRRCWLQRSHCICGSCRPLEGPDRDDPLPGVRRLFLLTHHKEVGLVVDTAKLLLAAFPETARLVVSGVGGEHQDSMAELMDAVAAGASSGRRRCMVLFPAEDARTFDEIEKELCRTSESGDRGDETRKAEAGGDDRWDVVVIDGTWSQARKMYNRYIPPEADGGPARVQLGEEVVRILGGDGGAGGAEGRSCGLQLRRHPIKWKEVSTFEATRLLLRDIMASSRGEELWDKLGGYQSIANAAARRQLGPPREV